MSGSPLPAGTATGNADAVRQSQIAQAFFLFADVLQGVDSQPRMEQGMSPNGGPIGPNQSFGVDVGIANDGTAYVRGRSTLGQDSMATPAHDAESGAPAKPAGFQMTPLLWVIAAVVAYKFLA